jgi:hypothetical protein
MIVYFDVNILSDFSVYESVWHMGWIMAIFALSDPFFPSREEVNLNRCISQAPLPSVLSGFGPGR